MSEQDDVEFLKQYMRKLQMQLEVLEELSDQELTQPDGPPSTSADAERCARLAEQHGFDGNVFRHLFWVPLKIERLSLLDRIRCIPRIIAKMEEEDTDPEETVRQMQLAMMDENARRLLAIAADGKLTADQKMSEILRIDQRFVDWTSEHWADLLHVTAAAVRQTDCWERLQKSKKADG